MRTYLVTNTRTITSSIYLKAGSIEKAVDMARDMLEFDADAPDFDQTWDDEWEAEESDD